MSLLKVLEQNSKHDEKIWKIQTKCHSEDPFNFEGFIISSESN